ncbi:MAG: L-threonylcarbamoyladenylate synthase [Blastocatellia bacterium]|jgi:L-threonylcarbamoyladenylate synthase
MRTRITFSPTRAAEYLRRGELVAFPTETVYGLGANLFDGEAIRKIFLAKGRPHDNPLIAHIASRVQLRQVAAAIPPLAESLIERFFPGPLTVLLPRHERVPLEATAGLSTIGVRMPDHRLAQRFLLACGVPVAAPSANLSGRPSPTTWEAVQADLDGRIACILRGEQTRVGLESTVVDCTGDRLVLLRAGAVSFEELAAFVPAGGLIDGTDAASSDRGTTPRSPGMKYRHYSPRAEVVVIDLLRRREEGWSPGPHAAWIGLRTPPHPERFQRIALCPDPAAYAHRLFAFFRQCDAEGIKRIFCQAVPPEGLGRAVMDRIRKAAFGSAALGESPGNEDPGTLPGPA